MTSTVPYTDPAFLERLRSREEAAIREIVHQFLPQVLRAAGAAGFNEDDAADVAQNTFVTFVEKVPEFEGRSHVRTWLFGILYRKIQEAYRVRARHGEHADIDDLIDERFDTGGGWTKPARDLELQLEDADLRSQIEDCLRGVPDRQRAAFVMREVTGLTTDELTRVLSVSVTNLGVLLYRARNRLRECLEGKGVRG